MRALFAMHRSDVEAQIRKNFGDAMARFLELHDAHVREQGNAFVKAQQRNHSTSSVGQVAFTQPRYMALASLVVDMQSTSNMFLNISFHHLRLIRFRFDFCSN